jgi:hypothetical protein
MEQGLLLTGPQTGPEETHVNDVAASLGVSLRALPVTELVEGPLSSPERACRLFCSGGTFVQLMEALDRRETLRGFWTSQVHSAFVWAGTDAETEKLLRRLTGESSASIRHRQCRGGRWKIEDTLPDLCGPLHGLSIAQPQGAEDHFFVCDKAAFPELSVVISTDGGAVFVRIEHQGVPVFISAAPGIVDVTTRLADRNFDVRSHFLSTVPAVAYAKWAFPVSSWKTPEISACLVIDDPLLRPQYGHLNFQEMLKAMNSRNFSTSIAFIPWNWRRNASETVRLFKENAQRYSLSIHGCDHTGAEFGTVSTEVLAWKANQALDRMDRLESRVAIPYDRVMVFPQGVFSSKAMSILKQANYSAAVNTEVVSVPSDQTVAISDVWDAAVMNYADFPIFTRRYPEQGVENFAFDVLLGKPCLVVIHHQNCRNHLKELSEFIDSLNALRCRLLWGSLADAVRRTYRQRDTCTGAIEIEMYGLDLDLRNHLGERKHFKVRKKEREPDSIHEVRIGSSEVSWEASGGYIYFETELDPGEQAAISIRFRGHDQGGRTTDTLAYRVKTALRRYLSEVRDNYVSCS